MRRFWWIAFLVSDGLLVVVFLAAYAARWIDPRIVWWPQLFAIGLPFLTLLLAACACILGFRKRWAFVAMHGALLLLAGVRFVSFDKTEVHPLDRAPHLEVVSYNLGQFDLFSQAQQAQKLSEILRLLHPDIVGLQEFMVRFRGETLRIRNMPYVAHTFDSLGFQSVASQIHEVSNTFQPLLSRSETVEQLEQRRIVLAEDGFPSSAMIRMVFRWHGREAIYYNLHLRTFGERKPWLEKNMSPLSVRFWFFYLDQYREAFEYRAWQAEKIREVMEQEHLPLIVSGDFNSTPHNWAFNHLAEGMVDVFERSGSTWKASYHTRFPLVRIDHMLVSPHWRVLRAEIPKLEYSDHRPLFVRLSWAGSGN